MQTNSSGEPRREAIDNTEPIFIEGDYTVEDFGSVPKTEVVIGYRTSNSAPNITDKDIYLSGVKPTEVGVKTTDNTNPNEAVAESINNSIASMSRDLSSANFINSSTDISTATLIQSIGTSMPDNITYSTASSVVNYILNNYSNVDPEDIDIASIFNYINYTYGENDARDSIMLDWVKSTAESVKKHTDMASDSATYQSKVNMAITTSTIYSRETFSNLFTSQSGEKQFFSRLYQDGNRITHFECVTCSADSTTPVLSEISKEVIVVYSVDEKVNALFNPQRCSKCGTIHYPHPKVLVKALSKAILSLNSGVKSLQKLSKVKIAVLTPSEGQILELLEPLFEIPYPTTSMLMNDLSLSGNVQDVEGEEEEEEVDFDFDDIESLESLFEEEEEEDEEETLTNEELRLLRMKEYDFDWEAICKEFRDLITMIGNSRTKFSGDSIHSLAVILGNQYSIYSKLKENSLSSLILALEADLQLDKFSSVEKAFVKVYSNLTLDALNDVSFKLSINSILASKIVKEDDEVDVEEFNRVVSNLKETSDMFDYNLKQFVKEILDNDYLAMRIPISDISLTEDYIIKYFYDENLVAMLDRISDLMILNHLSERIFDNIGVVTHGSSVDKLYTKRGTTSLKTSISGKGKSNKGINLIDKFSKLAESLSKDIQVNFIITMFEDYRDIFKLIDFIKACVRRDVFDIMKYKNSLEINYRVFENIPQYSNLVKLFQEVPIEDTGSDKFKYLFNFDCPAEYHSRFVSIYESKGVIPKEFEGETIEDKLDFYEKYESNDISHVSDNMKEFLLNNQVVISLGKYLDYSDFFTLIGPYFFMSDYLYALKDYSIDDFEDLFSIDKELCSFLLEDSFDIPTPDKSKLDLLPYLVLPSFVIEDLSDDNSNTGGSISTCIHNLNTTGIDSYINEVEVLGLTEVFNSLTGSKFI